MNLGLSLLTWVMVARAYLELGVDAPIAEAREQIEGREFWVLRDPSRPTVAWEAARDRNAVRYRVLIEVGLEDLLPSFLMTVGASLDDDRGWKAAGREFVRVDEREQFSIVLARPKTVDKLCLPLKTGGVYSCGRNGRASLNETRWRTGAKTFGDELDAYRVYMVNHEVGHLISMQHRDCHEQGEPAPIMLQQTKLLDGCTASSWPAEFELASLRKHWTK